MSRGRHTKPSMFVINSVGTVKFRAPLFHFHVNGLLIGSRESHHYTSINCVEFDRTS